MTGSSISDFFEKLFREYQPVLVTFARHFVTSEEDARDVVQDVFISVWKNVERLDRERDLKAYLFTATKNKCLDFIRKKRQTPANVEMTQEPVEPITSVDHLQTAELRSIIFWEVKNLPAKCREIFLLSRKENLTYKQISEKLEISVKTVENQMIIALKRIRESVQKYKSGDPKIKADRSIGSYLFMLFHLGVLMINIVVVIGEMCKLRI